MGKTSSWDAIGALYDKTTRLPRAVPAFLGFGMLLEWGCWLNSYMLHENLALASYDVITLADAVPQIVACLIMVVLARTLSPYYRYGLLYIGSFVLTLAATVILALFMFLGLSQEMLLFGVVIGGFGYACLFMLWVEALGCLKSKTMLLVYAVSTIEYFALSFLTRAMDFAQPMAYVYIGCLAAGSVILLISVFQRMPTSQLAGPTEGKPFAPWVLLFCTALFSLAFGINGGFIIYSDTDIYQRLGNLIPAIIAFLGIVFFGKRFDMPRFYNIALVFMVTGLAVVFFAGTDSLVTSILTQAGNESFAMLTVLIACSMSYRLRISAVYYYGAITVINMLVRIARILLGGVQLDPYALQIIHVVILVLATVAVFVLFRRTDIMYPTCAARSPKDSKNTNLAASDARELSNRAELSPREQVVYAYILQGYDATHISEELFISPSAVRAHMSNIYKKFGVHSRQELEDYLSNSSGD